MYPPSPPESSILVLFHHLPDLHHYRLAVPITEMNANVLKHSAFPYRLSFCKPGLACPVWPTPVSNYDDPPASPLLPPTPQCWDCRCGVLCLTCVHFLPYVLLFLILCFLLLNICGWLLYLSMSFLFSLQSPPHLRQYHCVFLSGGLELGVQSRLDLDLEEIHLPPPDLRCAPPCVLTSLLFLSSPCPHACQTVWSAGLHTCLASSFPTRLYSWPLLSFFIHPLLWFWLLNSLGPRVLLGKHFTLRFISSPVNLCC